MSQPARIYSIVEEPEPPPAPARALTVNEVKASIIDIWAAVRGIMGDDQADPAAFVESVEHGLTVVCKFGGNAGYVWIYQIDKGRSAAIGFAFSGDWRGFAKTHGNAREAQRTVLRWIMESFGLRKLRAFVARNNGKAYRMAERLGFTREGCLRGEYEKGGRYLDLYAYGLMRKEI